MTRPVVCIAAAAYLHDERIETRGMGVLNHLMNFFG